MYTSRSIIRMVAVFCGFALLTSHGSAQVIQQPVINNPVGPAPVFGPMGGMGGMGGASMADFDSLMQLITSTVQPESWEDVGGPGSVAPFATGVYIDPQGTLQKMVHTVSDGELSKLRRAVAARAPGDDVRNSSPLRKISLPRLEKQLQRLAAAGKGPTVDMGLLAGLRRIEYVFVYLETGDLVIAGPAGDWRLADENRFVSAETGEPIVRLEDLVVVFRQMTRGRDASFGCLIVPTQEGLARVKEFTEGSAGKSLKSGTRRRWLAQLQEKLGKQNLEVYGIDPRTRVASILLEADYRMKLVGMGLEPGVPGVESYLDLARDNDGTDGSMSVLRWWFTLNYKSVKATGAKDAFAILGPGAQVLSENELLEADGKRIHTGRSDALNREFAASFTRHFDDLCQQYPIYAELRNICDLALVGALIQRENLAETVDWHMPHIGDPASYVVQLGPMPQTVDSVINHRTARRGKFIDITVGVSGGVRIDPAYLLKTNGIATDRDGELADQRSTAPPAPENDRWWWD